MARSGSGDDYVGCLAEHLRAEEIRETSGVGLTNRLERFRVKSCGSERLARVPRESRQWLRGPRQSRAESERCGAPKRRHWGTPRTFRAPLPAELRVPRRDASLLRAGVRARPSRKGGATPSDPASALGSGSHREAAVVLRSPDERPRRKSRDTSLKRL
jgi:hypothetical protein